MNHTVSDCGLFINSQFPWVGATPDGIIHCDCHGRGVLEVKCPLCLTNSSIQDQLGETDFCLKKNDSGNTRLKQEHRYYYQVQAQLHVTDLEYCDFVVWGPHECFIERIFPDGDLFATNLVKVHAFINKCVLPELLGKWFSVPRVSHSDHTVTQGTGLGCYCGEPATDVNTMLYCSCDFCVRKTFHQSCLKLTRVSKKWKCGDCTKILNKQRRDKQQSTTSAMQSVWE